MLFEHNVLIGAGIGFIFAVLIFAALRLSLSGSYIRVTPYKIIWKDRYTNAEISLMDIVDFEFAREQVSEETPITSYEDYFKFTTKAGNSYKIVIDCWETPDESNSTDYIQSILHHYVEEEQKRAEQIREQSYDVEQSRIPTRQESFADESEFIESTEESSYLISETARITDDMIKKVDRLLGNQTKVSIFWLSSVTNIPENIVEEIILIHLGYPIENGYVLL